MIIQPKIGPYIVRPPDDKVISEFRDYIANGGRPEQFEGVKLDRFGHDAEHQMLTGFEVPEKFRTGDMVPCSICSADRPKFYAGILLWSSDGFLRLIGHQCGKKHLGTDRFDTLLKEMRHKQRLNESDHYLIVNYANVHVVQESISRLRLAAFPLIKRRNELHRKVPSLCKFLDNRHKEGPGLPLVRTLNSGSGGPRGLRTSMGEQSSVQEYWEQPIRGVPMFSSARFDPVARLDRLSASLPPDHTNPTAMENYVFGAHESVRIAQADALRTAPVKLKDIADQMREACYFLTTEYLTVLADWLDNPDCVLKRHSISLTNRQLAGFKDPTGFENIRRLDDIKVPELPASAPD